MFEAKLWRLLITSAVGPGEWTEQRADEGESVKYGSRQLGGCLNRCNGEESDRSRECVEGNELPIQLCYVVKLQQLLRRFKDR